MPRKKKDESTKQGKLLNTPKDAVGKCAEALKIARENVLDAQDERNVAEQRLIEALVKANRKDIACEGVIFSINRRAEIITINVKKQKGHD